MSKMTLSDLESNLWGAANILRGKIDSSDYKHYIFGLLFYKRLCDVWKDVRRHSTNIGEYLNSAFHSIEDANLRLKGVFQDVDSTISNGSLTLLWSSFYNTSIRTDSGKQM